MGAVHTAAFRRACFLGRAFVMRTIRKANFFYPGFEMAGAETQFERGLTRLFCMAAGIGMALYDALSAAHPKQQEG